MQALLVRLTMLGVPRMPAPRRLVSPEEGEEEDGDEPEGVDTDTFLQQLAGTMCIVHTCTLYIVHGVQCESKNCHHFYPTLPQI